MRHVLEPTHTTFFSERNFLFSAGTFGCHENMTTVSHSLQRRLMREQAKRTVRHGSPINSYTKTKPSLTEREAVEDTCRQTDNFSLNQPGIVQTGGGHGGVNYSQSGGQQQQQQARRRSANDGEHCGAGEDPGTLSHVKVCTSS